MTDSPRDSQRELTFLLRNLAFLEKNIQSYKESGAPQDFLDVWLRHRDGFQAEINRLREQGVEPIPDYVK